MASTVPIGFHFVESVAGFDVTDVLVVRIPHGVMRKRDLLTVFARDLSFPGYFGWNWDSLEECLGSLDWLNDSRRIVLLHEGLPFQPDWENRATYLNILKDAIAIWRPQEAHELIAVFPEHCRDDVLNAI